mgnify:CR=1 FL=1
MYKTKYEKLKSQLAEINVYEKDASVLRMLEIARQIYSTKLDIMSGHVLIRVGGELSALYVSFGNKHAQARADHEITENTYKQVLQNVQQGYLDGDSKYKVTEAKNLASKDMEVEAEDVVLKEAVYKQWENVMDTCKTLIMFIQSALASKKSEAFINKDLSNNQGQ